MSEHAQANCSLCRAYEAITSRCAFGLEEFKKGGCSQWREKLPPGIPMMKSFKETDTDRILAALAEIKALQLQAHPCPHHAGIDTATGKALCRLCGADVNA